MELFELDGANIIKYLFAHDTKKTEPLRCAVLDFPIKQGVARSDVFVVDTEETIILGEGNIDLHDEKLDLKLTPRAKHPSILSLRSPIHILGTFKQPKVRPDKTLAFRAGAVIVGALVNPLVALIPLVETGPGKDANCQALLDEAKRAPADNAKGGANKAATR
jgi:hypothetical protein